jgi:excisionase family DNA binding protein
MNMQAETCIAISKNGENMKLKPRKLDMDESQSWFTIKEAAEYLRVSEMTLRRATARGALKYKRPANKYLFHETWLHSWIYGYGKKLSPTQRHELQSLRGSQS